MADSGFETPIALFVFNRPEKAQRVIDEIAQVRPDELLIVADGPRDDHPTDLQKCNQTRSIVENAISWNCDIHRHYADTNLGLRKRFVTGLDWIFSKCEEAIILEDDCVPSSSFFHFCRELLQRYRDDERIMDISGTNYLGEWKSDEQDYHYSLYGGIWGWATWRRSWRWYDPDMELWKDPEIRDRVKDVIADSNQSGFLEYIYDRVHTGEIETWDYQWGFAKHRNSALSIVPARNLVSNIGFDETATNTRRSRSGWGNLPRYELDFPIRGKDFVAVDREYDRKFHKMRPISQRNAVLRTGRKVLERFQ